MTTNCEATFNKLVVNPKKMLSRSFGIHLACYAIVLLTAEIVSALKPRSSDGTVLSELKRNMMNGLDHRFLISEIHVCAPILDPSQRHSEVVQDILAEHDDCRTVRHQHDWEVWCCRGCWLGKICWAKWQQQWTSLKKAKYELNCWWNISRECPMIVKYNSIDVCQCILIRICFTGGKNRKTRFLGCWH